MRLIPTACCVALVGCTTASSAARPGPSETIRVAGGAGAMTAEIHPINDPIGAEVPVAMDRAWAGVRAAYDSLPLPVATFDVATRTIASPTVRLRRRLGETALSKYLNCGTAQGGQGADTYEVQLLVQTALQAGSTAGTTRIMTSITAEGRPITLSGDYSRCSSTGNLERRIIALVSASGR